MEGIMMRFNLKSHSLISLYLLFVLLLICTSTLAALNADKPVFRIGVVYHVGDTGNRILNGINSALSSYEEDGGRFNVELIEYPYLDETAGIDSIFKIFENSDEKDVHLILGPTDSGVFVNLEKRTEYAEKASVPLVSSLVTSQEGNKAEDWRFRTNVDVEARSRAISDHLNHAGYQAVGVLYRNNEFGERAEQSFKSQFSQAEEDYLALPYQNEAQLRDQVRKIIERRPGAVGVFGRRHEVKFVKAQIAALNNGWFDYQPLIFSINDTRTLKLAETYFVSMVEPNIQGDEASAEIWDEVRGLAHDTTLLVLSVANQIKSNPARGEWAAAFKKRLFSRMLGPPQPNPKFKTHMEFSDGKNMATPKVLTINVQNKEAVPVAGRGIKQMWKLGDWIEIRQRRYGLAIWFNIGLVIVIAFWLTMADIHRRQTFRTPRIYMCRSVLALLLFNIICATATLVVVAETGVIRWDNVLAALGVAVGYRAMLTTTIFETAQGRALGFGRLYERTLNSINQRIMLTLYEKQSAAINYVTHTNSVPNMRDLLVNIYSFAQDGADSRTLINELDAEIARASGPLKQQEVCARRLLQTMTWKQLQENRIIPEYIRQNEIIDPNTLLRDSVQYVMRHDDELKDKVKSCVNEALDRLMQDSQKNHDQAKSDLQAHLDKSQTERGRVYCRLRWLFTQWGFSLRRIKQKGLLPDDYGMNRHSLSRWSDRLFSWGRHDHDETGPADIGEERSAEQSLNKSQFTGVAGKSNVHNL